MPMESLFVFLFSFFLSTQLGKHFFFPFSYLSGIRIDYLAPTLYVTDIFSLILVIYAIKKIILSLRAKYNTAKQSQYIIALLLIFLLIINYFFALSKPLWIYSCLRVVQWTAIFFYFKTQSRNKSIFSAVLYGLLAGGIFELVLSLFQLVNRHSIQGWWYYAGERSFSIFTPGIAKAYFMGKEFLRPYGTFSHPNSLAGFYLLLYTFALTQKRITNPFLKISLLIITSTLVLISFSRTAIVVYVLINLLFFLKNSSTCRVCLIAKIIMASFLVVFALNISGDLNSLQKRNDFTQKAISIIAQKPFSGTGMGSYLIAQHQYPQKFSIFFEQPVHNIFLLAMSQLGIPLFLILLMILFNRFKRVSFFPLLVVILSGCMDHYWLTLQQNVLVSAVIFGILYSYETKTSRSR